MLYEKYMDMQNLAFTIHILCVVTLGIWLRISTYMFVNFALIHIFIPHTHYSSQKKRLLSSNSSLQRKRTLIMPYAESEGNGEIDCDLIIAGMT